MALNLDIDVDSLPSVESVSILNIDGEVDVLTSGPLKVALTKLVDSGTGRIIVNLNRVQYMDSTGLGVLVTAMKRMREREGEIVLTGLSPHLTKIFEITGLRKAFRIVPTEDEALAGS